ncbi:MAG: hypothetical protein J2O48_00495 [Solirubrobacterales bacterium]|nr:hypothetical protein [Solirubrobacterales bacterium]
MSSADEVLILGASGRTGRAIAARLDAAGVPLALYGRDATRLETAAQALTQNPRLVTGSLTDLRARLNENHPAVVLNTVGPFADTAARVIDALPEGTHYLDLSNEYPAFQAVFDRHNAAVAAHRTLVPGAGFGVVATDSVLLALLEGKPTPTHVRVDAAPSVALEAAPLGDALAASIVGGLPLGRRQVRDGLLISKPFDDNSATVKTPDGELLTSANFTSGDLFTAARSSQAPNVVSASTEVPSGAMARYALPPFFVLSRSPRVRGFLTKRLARVEPKARPRPRPHSWARAAATWPDGDTGEAWLRVQADAMDFTAAAAAEVAKRLQRGEGKPGVHTPCELFGSGLAEAAGGELLLN